MNCLPREKLRRLRDAFQDGAGIRLAGRLAGVARNTARRYGRLLFAGLTRSRAVPRRSAAWKLELLLGPERLRALQRHVELAHRRDDFRGWLAACRDVAAVADRLATN